MTSDYQLHIKDCQNDSVSHLIELPVPAALLDDHKDSVLLQMHM